MKPGMAMRSARCSSSYQRLKSSSCAGSMSVIIRSRPFGIAFFSPELFMAVDLNHRITGSGPHVLLLHAVGMDSTFLQPLAAILAKDFTVLTADARGHGKSPYAPSTGLADYADDIHALLT